MKLILILHAAAEPATPELPDDRLPLSAEGERGFRAAARGIAALVDRPDALLTSPLLRARQTADLVAQEWHRTVPREVPALAGGRFEEWETALAPFPVDSSVALVSHEPHLSCLLARLLAAAGPDALAFRKGGAALVEVPARRLEHGVLTWFLPPRVLRRLGRG
jgi:phosphohistidine phosphatase